MIGSDQELARDAGSSAPRFLETRVHVDDWVKLPNYSEWTTVVTASRDDGEAAAALVRYNKHFDPDPCDKLKSAIAKVLDSLSRRPRTPVSSEPAAATEAQSDG
jgi:hypothetical protein